MGVLGVPFSSFAWTRGHLFVPGHREQRREARDVWIRRASVC